MRVLSAPVYRQLVITASRAVGGFAFQLPSSTFCLILVLVQFTDLQNSRVFDSLPRPSTMPDPIPTPDEEDTASAQQDQPPEVNNVNTIETGNSNELQPQPKEEAAENAGDDGDQASDSETTAPASETAAESNGGASEQNPEPTTPPRAERRLHKVPQPEPKKPWSGIGKTALAAGIAGAVLGPVAVVGAITWAGFTASGIVAGSWAAGFMASYGGAVASGSACAVMQSIGAAGLGVAGTTISAAAGAGIGASVGAGTAALVAKTEPPKPKEQ